MNGWNSSAKIKWFSGSACDNEWKQRISFGILKHPLVSNSFDCVTERCCVLESNFNLPWVDKLERSEKATETITHESANQLFLRHSHCKPQIHCAAGTGEQRESARKKAPLVKVMNFFACFSTVVCRSNIPISFLMQWLNSVPATRRAPFWFQ